MKRICFFMISITVLVINMFAAAPQSFKYQAVIRNASGDVIPDRNISIRLSIIKNNISGTAVYTETHNVISSNLGLINLEIGKGSPVFGSMDNIDWGNDAYFIKIEMDENGGSNYTLFGTSQLVSVPYALYAQRAANGTQWEDTLSDIYYSTGKVGIGTNTPASNLDIHSSTDSRVTISGSIPTIRLTDTAYTGNGVTIGVAADSNDLITRSGKGDLVLTNEAYGTGGGYIFGTGVPSQTCVKITDDCNVGIGTDTPVSKLDIKGGDINIESIGSGVIMKSPDGNCWRMTVSNTGQPVLTSIDCFESVLPTYDCSDAVACYSFNGNVNDLSGNNFNGTVVGASLITDRHGNANSAYYFRGYQSGDPDYIDLPTIRTIFNNSLTDFSMSIWAKQDSVGQSPTIFAMISSDNEKLSAGINWNNTIIFDFGNITANGRQVVNSTNVFNRWDHYVFVRSKTSNTMSVYRNNVLVGTKSSSSDITNLDKVFRIGGGGGTVPFNQYFVGSIDDVKIFNHALTATEVSAIYNAER